MPKYWVRKVDEDGNSLGVIRIDLEEEEADKYVKELNERDKTPGVHYRKEVQKVRVRKVRR